MKKKLAMAAALLPNPDLLFLDEPFEGVDAVTSRVIRDLLASFVTRGSTVFLTSHVLEIVERLVPTSASSSKESWSSRLRSPRFAKAARWRIVFFKKRGPTTKARASSTGSRRRHRELATVAGSRVAAVAAVGQPVAACRRALTVALMVIVTVGALVTAIPLFIGSFVIGQYAIPKAAPAHLMYVWDDFAACVSVLLERGRGHRTPEDRTLVTGEIHAPARLDHRGVSD